MLRVEPRIARLYPEKYKIRFDELVETEKHERSILVANHTLNYTLHANRLEVNSGIRNEDEENLHFMEAVIMPSGLLNIGLVTWEQEHGYFPLFYAHGFLDMVLEHFSGQYDGVEGELYKTPRIDQMFREFFRLYSAEAGPEQTAANIRLGRWLSQKGFTQVIPSKTNIYDEMSSVELKFTYYQGRKA